MILVLFFIALVSVVDVVNGCDLDQFTDWAANRLQQLGKNVTIPCEALTGGFSSPNGSLPHIFLFQSDEHEVLTDWLQYHSYLVGLKNIHIVDHHSQNPQICKVLALYKACGVDITIEDSFLQKHKALSDQMKLYNDTFLIPMDADEFITAPTPSSPISTDRDVILNNLRNLSIDGRKYKFSSVVARYPASECKLAAKTAFDPKYRRVTKKAMAGPPQYSPHMLKTFFYSDGFIGTDQGNHHGIVLHDQGHNMSRDPTVKNDLEHYFQFTNLTLLHYFASSYYSMRQKTLRAVKAYGFTKDTNCDKVTTGGVQYCRLGKSYQVSGLSSMVHYLQNCRMFDPLKGAPAAPVVSLTTFGDWFKEHARSFSELIGEDIIPMKDY